MKTELSRPVTSIEEQATGYAPAENGNQSLTDSQGSGTPGSNCAAQSTTSSVPLEKCLCGTYITGTKLPNPNLGVWGGIPLKEDVVYHRTKMLGLPECTIMENRDARARAEKWQETCREKGMVSPGLYVKAKAVKGAGLTPAIYLSDTKSWWIVPDDLLEYYYLRLDANGRAAGHDLDLEKAVKDPNYVPFDFTFVYKEVDDPDKLFNQYISVNSDVKKTTITELLCYSSCRNKGSKINNYYAMIGEGFVAKAAAYYTFGREITKEDIQKASDGQDINVAQNLVDCMGILLQTYRGVFSGKSSLKILKGVPLARWSYDTLKNNTNPKDMAMKISDTFKSMAPEQLSSLQDAKGVKGDRTQTLEIVLIRKFNEILDAAD